LERPAYGVDGRATPTSGSTRRLVTTSAALVYAVVEMIAEGTRAHCVLASARGRLSRWRRFRVSTIVMWPPGSYEAAPGMPVAVASPISR
jgi:hypothetical protein